MSFFITIGINMPELPEVEVVRSVLDQDLKNLRITSIECLYPSIIIDKDKFVSHVEGKRILEVKRYAKFLIFILEDGAFLSHLRMEGKYFYVEEDYPIAKHQHVIFHLDNQHKLIYQDVRKFGRMEYKQKEDIYTTAPLIALGPEANSLAIDTDALYQKLLKKNIPIKTLLLDQGFISGLGNIYVDEVLFKAKINPLRLALSLSKRDLNQILTASQEILACAILNKGTTIRSYTSSLGKEGSYQAFLSVHTKTTCPLCLSTLNKIKIGGRTSYFCLKCQK